MRRAAFFLLWWIGLWWLWMLLVGEWNRLEWRAGAVAATIGATVAEGLRSTGLLRSRVPGALVLRSWSAVPMVFVDFGILTAALARTLAGRRVEGEFRRKPSARGDGDEARGVRSWITIVAGFSPNAYVVDFDEDAGTVLFHDLVPFDRSESPG